MSTMIDQPTFDLVKGNSGEEEEVSADEFWPLSGGEPFFSVFVMKSNLAPLYQMTIPVKIHQSLPPAPCPMVINYRGKKWELTCRSSSQRRRYANWKKFVIDNDLKNGDACVFERSNYSERLIEFKVQILKGGNPLELVEEDDGTIDTPIVIH